jgi:ADP-ribose pyrophosphatase
VSSRADYHALVEKRPELFANPPGAGFEILLDEDGIRRAETQMERHLTDSGGSPEWAQVGIAFRDQYVMVVRDAVRYADGSLGTYIRMVDLFPGILGVVILPVYEQQVLLIRHFRHATRSWHLEIPRGFGIEADSTASARRELWEEVGAEATCLTELGEIHPDTGASAGRVAMFLAEVEAYGRPEVMEAITEILPTPIVEFERMIASGDLSDGFLLAAYARAKSRGLM